MELGPPGLVISLDQFQIARMQGIPQAIGEREKPRQKHSRRTSRTPSTGLLTKGFLRPQRAGAARKGVK